MEARKKMKRTTIITSAILLLVVLVLSGCKGGVTGGAVICNEPYILAGDDCCLDSDANQICDKDETKPVVEPVEPPKEEVAEEQTEEPVTEIPEEVPQTTNEFQIKLGESIRFDGKTVTLIGLENIPRLKAIFIIDSVERDVYGTKEMELINGIKVTTLKYLNLENSVIVKLEKLVLKEGEYLIDTRKDVIVQGKTIHLEDVKDDGEIILHILGNGIEGKPSIDEGETEEISGLKITNLYGFPSGFKLDRLAIIKVQ